MHLLSGDVATQPYGNYEICLCMYLSISSPTPRPAYTPGGDLTLTLVLTPGTVVIEVKFKKKILQLLLKAYRIALATQCYNVNSTILYQNVLSNLLL